MGLRTQLKNIIKKALGRETNTPAPPYTPPTPKPDPVVAPTQPEPIETTEQELKEEKPLTQEEQEVEPKQPEEQKTEEKGVEEQEAEEQEAEEQEAESSSDEDSSSSSEEEEEAEEEQKEPSSDGASQEVDTEGAVAVYPIKNLFGESCPNCGASTFNNWAYSDNAFVCQSCDSTL